MATPMPALPPEATMARRRLPLKWLLVGGLCAFSFVLGAVVLQAQALRQQHAAAAHEQAWFGAMARLFALQVHKRLGEGGAGAAEHTLHELSALVPLREARVVDPQGRPLLTLARTGDGRLARAELDAGALDWTGGPLGSVGLAFVPSSLAPSLAGLQRDVWLGALVIALATFAMAAAFVGQAVRPLDRLVRFSRGLAEGGGDRLEPVGAHEMAELALALNDAAITLQSQRNALRQHDSAQAALLDAVPDALIGLDAACHVSIANPSLRAVFGIEPDQALGRGLEQLLPGIDAAEAEQRTMQGLYMRSTGTRVARFELLAQRADGTPFPAEVSLTRTERGGLPSYAALVRDLTESRAAMDLVHLYGRALECTTNGVVISDVTLPGKPVFYANPAFYRITGYEPADTVGRNCDFLQREDTQQPEIEQVRRAVAEQRSTQVVLRNYRKDGTLFFNELVISPVAEPSGEVRHFVGVITDVTERERSRMAIAERSARLNAVFELSPDGFVVFDEDGCLVYCNRAFLDMAGWPDEAEVLGMTLQAFEARLLAQCDGVQPPRPLDHALAEGAAASPDTLLLARPERRVLARLARRQHTGLVETILFFRDVTRETEVDRMKSEFLTTAAHELRTPMVSVFGFTELLLRREVPEARRRDMLETIHRQASLLIHMVNELLDLARIEARQGKDLRPAACRVGELVEAAVAPLRDQPRGSDIDVWLPDADECLFVDHARTLQALTNVLSNAIKYSPAGGTILLQTRRGRVDGRPALGLSVADRGIGMTAAQQARVFERFFRADPSGNIPGTGLGMSIVKEIVELQHGRVDLASEPGRGTTVTLWLPLAGADAGASPVTQGAPLPAALPAP